MRPLLKTVLPTAFITAAAFGLGFTFGTRHGIAQAGFSLDGVKRYYELGKQLGETIKKIDHEVEELQKDSAKLKEIKAGITGEKLPAKK